MTNSPEVIPDSGPTPTTTEPRDHEPTTTEGTLDAGTYDRLVEPRSENRLALEAGVWHQISRKYVWVQLISTGLVLR